MKDGSKLWYYKVYCDEFFKDKENQKDILNGAKFRLHIHKTIDKETKKTLEDCIITEIIFEMEAAGIYLEENFKEIKLYNL
jgi:hypothetical protein